MSEAEENTVFTVPPDETGWATNRGNLAHPTVSRKTHGDTKRVAAKLVFCLLRVHFTQAA